LAQPLPQVTRALIIVHGRLRNAQTYLQSGVEAAELAGLGSTTLVIAPQFLNETDVKRNHLAERLLRWNGNEWMAGAPSTGPGRSVPTPRWTKSSSTWATASSFPD
jgi:hypothetical protein